MNNGILGSEENDVLCDFFPFFSMCACCFYFYFLLASWASLTRHKQAIIINITESYYDK